MAEQFFLEILVPDRKFFSDYVTELNVKTPGGEIGILKGHMPLVVAIDIGPAKIKKDGNLLEAFLSEGYMEILEDKVTIIADTAEWPEEIDINRAKAAEERARERLRNKLSRVEYLQSQAALRRALSRLRITRQIK
jgi:F-type H+-transporting ATPase subunit epsilon